MRFVIIELVIVAVATLTSTTLVQTATAQPLQPAQNQSQAAQQEPTCDTLFMALPGSDWKLSSNWTNGLPGPDQVACFLSQESADIFLNNSAFLGRVRVTGNKQYDSMVSSSTIQNLSASSQRIKIYPKRSLTRQQSLGGKVAGTAETRTAYRNEIDEVSLIHVPGANQLMADDLNLSTGATSAISYEIAVFGLGTSGNSTFDAQLNLWNGQPCSSSSSVIPGTFSFFSAIPNDGQTVVILQVDLQQPTSVPGELWLSASFSTSDAGWVVAGVPQQGFTQDRWWEDDTSNGCTTFFFGGDPYAGFWATVLAQRTNNPFGACCLGSGCLITDRFDCQMQGGHFKPEAVGCFASTCSTGVCCTTDPACEDRANPEVACDLSVVGTCMTAGICAGIGGDYVGGAQCDETDPCERSRLPSGFEMVEVSFLQNGGHGVPYINDCGQIVFGRGPIFLDLPEREIFLYDNGQVKTVTLDPTRSNAHPDVNNHETLTWINGRDGFIPGDVYFQKDSTITVLGPTGGSRINNLDHVTWYLLEGGCAFETVIKFFDGISTKVIFDDDLSNQTIHLNDHDEVAWENTTFPCGGACCVWTSEIKLMKMDQVIALPAIADTPQMTEMNNTGTVAFSSFDLVEIWKNGVTTSLADGHGPSLNELGDVAYSFKTRITPWSLNLYRDAKFLRLTSELDIENIIDHIRADINESGEITWWQHPNGAFNPSAIQFMRRIRNGDVNFDGVVDVDDFLAMPGCFTGSVDTDRLCQCRFYDMDHDRDVDLDDLDLFLRVYPGPTNDCDNNGTSDFEELLVGTASDCNLNAIPDGCEAGDLDGDGMLDSCCLPTTPILSSTGVRNRYLTFKTINQNPFKLPGMGVQGEPVAMHNVNQAIRVTIAAAPANPPAGFETLVGKSFWVALPKTVCENSGQNFNVPPEDCGPAAGLLSNTFLMASLQCDPVFAPWFELGEVHVQHQMIIPGATYAIELINEGCSLATASNFSAALTVTNSRWGDVVENCSTSPCGPPDGVVNITTDVTAVLEKFKNAPTAPSKSRTDIEPSIPDGKINFTDVTFTLDAFTQQPYPFTPTPLICP